MKYGSFFFFFAAALMWLPSPVLADEASKLAKAEELMQFAMGDQMMKTMQSTMKAMTATMGKDLPADKRAKAAEIQEKSMALAMAAFDKAKPALAKAYADTYTCLLYTSDAADERSSVDLGGRRIIK